MTLLRCWWGKLHSSAIVHPPLPPRWWEGEGGWAIFQKIYIGGLRSNWDFGWELALKGGGDFFRWELKTPCTKSSEYKSQAKRKTNKQKKDSDCKFYNFSLLVPYPNKFVVVCICIVVFHSIYSPLPTNIFFVGG